MFSIVAKPSTAGDCRPIGTTSSRPLNQDDVVQLDPYQNLYVWKICPLLLLLLYESREKLKNVLWFSSLTHEASLRAIGVTVTALARVRRVISISCPIPAKRQRAIIAAIQCQRDVAAYASSQGETKSSTSHLQL